MNNENLMSQGQADALARQIKAEMPDIEVLVQPHEPPDSLYFFVLVRPRPVMIKSPEQWHARKGDIVRLEAENNGG